MSSAGFVRSYVVICKIIKWRWLPFHYKVEVDPQWGLGMQIDIGQETDNSGSGEELFECLLWSSVTEFIELIQK